ncbi:MAG: T9SS type A sorting domain-containing protein [Phaeodactylibacter sp.]|nr:T9SS type A sorting domain-containing protein [Phaeodactylibacter sp.]
MKTPFTTLLLFLAMQLAAQEGSWDYFGPAAGLECLAARGNTILVGTEGAGLVRFDTLAGRSFINTGNSGIPSDSIRQLAIDTEGNWWMHHPGGIGRFDGANWQSWSLAETGLPAAAAIRALKAAPGGSLYLATYNGAAIFQAGSWSVLNMSNSGLPSNNLWDVAFGPDGKVYYATAGSGLAIQDGADWTVYNSANAGSALLNNNVFSVALTADGALWAISGFSATQAIRLAKFEGGTWTGYSGLAIGLTIPFLRKILVDEFGRLWLTTPNSVSVFEVGTWAHYYTEDIGCDIDGTVWPAADGAGRFWSLTGCQLARFDGQSWNLLSSGLPGLPSGIVFNGLAEGPDGSLWFGAENGSFIAQLDGDTWNQYFPADFGAFNYAVYSIQAGPEGRLWFGLGNGEILLNEDGVWSFFDTCAAVFPGSSVWSSATAPNGDQWFALFDNGGTGGLAHYANGEWRFFTQLDSTPVLLNFVNKFAFEADGTAWFATDWNGLYRYDGTNWQNFTTGNAALPDNTVRDLAISPEDGSLWACTRFGLSRYDGQSWSLLTAGNSGLPSNDTRRITFDNAGGMYVGYAGGIVAVLRDGAWTELIPPAGEGFTDDVPWGFKVDSRNRLWFAFDIGAVGSGKFGVYRYDPMLVRTEETALAENGLKVYPNPTTGALAVLLETKQTGDVQLRLCNIQGQTVYSSVVPQADGQPIQVDLGRLPAGVYWLSAIQGGRLYTTKVLKQKNH